MIRVRQKLGDEIAESLRQDILAGRYEAGQRIPLDALAQELDVSSMPVREALITLSNEGLVDVEPRRGFRARPLSQGDLDDLFEVQAVLTGILAARAAEAATEEDIENLRAIHSKLEALSERSLTKATLRDAARLNAEFHRYIAKIPNGDRIRWFLRLSHRYVREDLYEAVPGILDASLADHPKIIAALERGDAIESRRLAEDHFAQGSKLVGCLIEAPAG